MRKLLGFLTFIAVCAFFATPAMAQVTVSFYGGGTKVTASGYEHYLVGNDRLAVGSHAARFQIGSIVGVKIGYDVGRHLRLEARLDHAGRARGNDPGFFDPGVLDCFDPVSFGFVECDNPPPRTSLASTTASTIVAGRVRIITADLYVGAGPALRRSILTVNATPTTSTDLGLTAAFGLQMPIGGRAQVFVEYNPTWTRAAWNVRGMPEAFLVDELGMRNLDHRILSGFSLRL